MFVWLNGQFVDRDAAQVSVFDAGFQHGVGLFETMLARHGAVFRADAHMQRLANSAKELLLSDRLRIEPLIEAVHHTIERNNFDQARIRLTITGGNLSLSWTGTGTLQQTDSLTSPNWQSAPSQTNPQTVPVGATGARFYRIAP